MRKGRIFVLATGVTALAAGIMAAAAPAGSAATGPDSTAGASTPGITGKPGAIHPVGVLAAPSQANCLTYGDYRLLHAAAGRAAYNLAPLYAQRDHRQGRDDRDRRLVRVADDRS